MPLPSSAIDRLRAAIFGTDPTQGDGAPALRLQLVGTLTFSSVTLSAQNAIFFEHAESRVIPGVTSLSFRNNADNADNLLIADSGAITVRSTISGVTTLTATTLAGTLSTAAQPNVTSVGTLTALTLGGTLNMSNNPVTNIGVAGTDFGADGSLTLAAALTVSAGGVTVTGASTFNSKVKVSASYGDIAVAADGATVTFDLNVSDVQQVTLGGNRTLALSNVSVGQMFALRLVQDGTGTRTVTWFATIRWAGGAAPTLTTTANKADWIGLVCTGSGTYDGWVIAANV
jgi:hypothetical protein